MQALVATINVEKYFPSYLQRGCAILCKITWPSEDYCTLGTYWNKRHFATNSSSYKVKIARTMKVIFEQIVCVYVCVW